MASSGREEIQKRAAYSALGVLLVVGLLGGRLGYLQIVRYPYYKSQATANFLRQIPIPAPRGEIVDKNGKVVATNRIAWALYYLSKGDPMPPAEVTRVSSLLGMPRPQIVDRIHQALVAEPSYRPILVKSDLSEAQFVALQTHRAQLPNIRIQGIPVRYYPFKNTAAQLLGYVSNISSQEYARLQSQGYHLDSVIGQSGVEATYQQYLRGAAGQQMAEVNRLGQVTQTYSVSAPVPGATVHLTIDWRLQQTAQNALAYVLHTIQTAPNGAVRSPGAQAGAVVVMDVHTGAILAMASLPAYDPNIWVGGISTANYNQIAQVPNPSLRPLVNYVTQGLFAPGSTFKPFMALGALADGVITPQTTIWDPGYFPKDPQFKNWYPQGFGAVNVVSAIMHSDDTFFYYLGLWMHLSRMQQWIRNFQLNQPTGIDLPGEVTGIMPSKKLIQKLEGIPWTWGQDLNTAIGQGLNMYTPIALVRATAAVANGGTLLWPHVVDHVTASDGQVLLTNPPKVQGHLPAPLSAFQTVWAGQEASAQNSQGTGNEALAGFPIPLASKTGTAEIPPLHSIPNAFFETYGPMPNPRIAIIVYVHRGLWGADTGWVARAIYDQYFHVADPTAKGQFDAVFGGNLAWPFGYKGKNTHPSTKGHGAATKPVLPGA